MVRLDVIRLLLTALLLIAAGCRAAYNPELRVVGVNNVPRHEVVFVQVTNPASRPMRLTKLEYVFAAAGGIKVFEGEVAFEREVPAGQAIVVEVPLDAEGGERPTTLRGRLTAQLDEIVHTFAVSADIH